jgi:asparagine synthase (glutamine-hydrolysing)
MNLVSLADRAIRAWRRRTDPTWALCETIGAEGLTFIEPAGLHLLATEARRLDSSAPAGAIFIEVGCASGGSSIIITRHKSPQREFDIHDVFGQIPPPTDQDFSDSRRRYEVIASGQATGLAGRKYYGYEKDLLHQVKTAFHRYGAPPEENSIRFLPGDVRQTLSASGPPIAFAHLDCDWYEPVRHSLEMILSRLIPGGVVIVDDYYSYKGCTAAVWDVLRDRLDSVRLIHKQRLMIRKES